MDTHFASPERADRDQLAKEITLISDNVLVDGLMRLVPGLFMVLNRHRQILVINEAMLVMLNVGSAHDVLGLRPGEAVHCVHAGEMPGGCGTSQCCASCGAAIAIVTALCENTTVEKYCTLTFHQENHEAHLYLSVRCTPLSLKGELFLLVFLQDITRRQKMAFLTRSFLHDISNTISGLMGLLQHYENEKNSEASRASNLLQRVSHLSTRLAREVEIHRLLFRREQGVYTPQWEPVTVLEILKDIGDAFAGHPEARDKDLLFPQPSSDLQLVLTTDRFLSVRVLSNMVLNALEASSPGDTVRVSVSRTLDRLTFSVWNKGFISPEIARRIFERDFTTHAEEGRGLGAYTMKRFGEECLGGTVDFLTSPENGTTFSFTAPI
ncbi:sensor histidine kinase [Desulfosudis oleivorans]|uniref:histidine kinase n=1 Tax=Desulfosudis oleivorans (strain DSM 6200 / JCM 39069 / Hxd3) TaxID=96561 RepID=A9A0K0_DESOH|nr:sensor histidine kinase [Desulfosudis oleivorans]ABW67500.1 histidine kinase [Desulfosudis oleivorans Hxd3]